MAEVRDGWDLKLSRPVAIKLLHPGIGARPENRLRFETEARAAAKLSCRHIVVVHDIGEHDGLPFIVMERLPGVSLADHIARGGGLRGTDRAAAVLAGRPGCAGTRNPGRVTAATCHTAPRCATGPCHRDRTNDDARPGTAVRQGQRDANRAAQLRSRYNSRAPGHTGRGSAAAFPVDLRARGRATRGGESQAQIVGGGDHRRSRTGDHPARG
jgi:hypothetical protein